jgi:hypothetical protein
MGGWLAAVEEVAALPIAGAWLLVQSCAFLHNCCCAKKGNDDKRGCFTHCCVCVCRVLCCGNELQLQVEDCRRRAARWCP